MVIFNSTHKIHFWITQIVQLTPDRTSQWHLTEESIVGAVLAQSGGVQIEFKQ